LDLYVGHFKHPHFIDNLVVFQILSKTNRDIALTSFSGSLNDMTDFFSELKTNLKKVEDDQLTPEQVRLLDADPDMSRQGELIGKDKGPSRG
jgi:hypothetical protein